MLARLLDRGEGSVDALKVGLYRYERRNHVPVPVRVWFGPPIDDETGKPLDRSHRWQLWFDGIPMEAFAQQIGRELEELLDHFWPRSRDNVIDNGEYQYLIDTARHARAYEPNSPFARSNGRVDLDHDDIPTIGGNN